MKTIALLIAFITASAALVVPPSINNRKSLLKTRDDGQQLTNPDKEDPYQDAISGGSIEKSRVLSGVGPSEANDRHFDWDESCADEKQRKKIITAFGVMQELTTRASGKLKDLKDSLPEAPGKNINNENRKIIAKTDFAYTQMFKARDNNIDDAKALFDKLTANVKNFPNRAAPDAGALRFICSADNHVKKGDGTPLCGKNKENQALTHIPQGADDREIEQKYSFSKSSSITFCPAFFDDDQFPNLEDIIGHQGTDVLTLDKVNCRERILLHEYMHLPWVGDLTPKPDEIGYARIAQNTNNQRTWGAIASQPDAFAWYALYSYFNNVDGGCGDAWPSGETKPVVIT